MIQIILFVRSLYNKYQYFYPQDLDHIQDLRHSNIFESVQSVFLKSSYKTAHYTY